MEWKNAWGRGRDETLICDEAYPSGVRPKFGAFRYAILLAATASIRGLTRNLKDVQRTGVDCLNPFSA